MTILFSELELSVASKNKEKVSEMRLHVPPQLVIDLMSGHPVKLSKAEEEALVLFHVGGISSLTNSSNKVKVKTITNLVRKGLFKNMDECTRSDKSVSPGGLTAFGEELHQIGVKL